MKKIILISLFLIVINGLTAQEKADFFTKNLDAYVGTWEYTSATCTFRIYLKKGKDYYRKGGPLSSEIIYGGHYIAYNGIVITDLESIIKTANDEDTRMTIWASNAEKTAAEVNPNLLIFTFFDDLKDKRGSGKLTLIPGNPAKLRWQILGMSATKIFIPINDEPMPAIQQGWTVPEDVVLTKISNTIGLPKPKELGPDDEVL